MSDENTIVIAGAARTPVGSFSGALASVPAHELGRVAIAAAMERAGVEGGDVDEVIMGQILTAGGGQNPARQASIAAGISCRRTGVGHEPIVRLGASRSGAGRSANSASCCERCRRGRAGKHEPGATLCASA